jgi:glycosyltransferase involved in cell wall biosynthesis
MSATDPLRVALIEPASIAETARRMGEAMTRFSRLVHARSDAALLDQVAARGALRQAYEESGAAPGDTRVRSRLASVAAPRSNAAPAGRSAAGTRVCVLIPAYNAERYLRQAMDSVLGQSVRDLELIIIDDGSADGTPRIATSTSDDRVHVLTGPNRGRAHARNRGFAASAPSAYVALLDADDLWDAQKLERQIDFLERHPDVVAVGCFMRYISSTGRVLGQTGQRITEADMRRIARGELAPFPISSCVLVRRDPYVAIDGFDETLREAEDLDFIARLARRGRIACLAEVLGSYRLHPESAMARRRLQVKMYARFVRERLAAADAGGTLTWEQYTAAYQPTWRERHEDLTELWYRSAALWHGEGKTLRALGYGALAALASPAYTLRRLRRQWIRVASHHN